MDKPLNCSSPVFVGLPAAVLPALAIDFALFNQFVTA
jgi:hypothetical protein